MPFAQWPAMDREAWVAAVTSGDILDECGRAAHWSSRTRQKRIESYGRWLTYLALRGILDKSNRPEDRVRRDTVATFIDELSRARAPYTVLCRIEDLYSVMRAFAPDRDWIWLRRAANRLRARITRGRDKEHRVRPSKDLYALGVRLMREAEACDPLPPLERAVRYRDGLMIALLAARPLRVSNFACMLLGKNLVATTDGYWLRFEASECKNRRPIDVPMPVELTPFLERYLERHRPVLSRGGESHRLWVAKTGSAMTRGSIYGRIVDLTRRAFGEAVNPHLFRDCAATSVAIDDPDHVRIAATLLGHPDLRPRGHAQDPGREVLPRRLRAQRRRRKASISRW